MYKYLVLKRLCAFAFFCMMLYAGVAVSADTIEVSSSEEFSSALHRLDEKYSSAELLDQEDTAFVMKRLIVAADIMPEVVSASDVILYDENLYVLFYETEEQTQRDYELLCRYDGVAVICDRILTTHDTAGEADKKSYSSWGPVYVGADVINESICKRYGSNLPEIKVAVVDSGIDYTHPRLEGRIAYQYGYDFVNNDADAMDDHYSGHGTHVAGIICDATLDNVKVIPYKAMDQNGRGSIANMIAAFKAAETAGADVINFSLGGPLGKIDITEDTRGFFEKIRRDDKMVVVSAVGNITPGEPELYFPACMDGVIGVGNCDSDGIIYASSNYNETVDLAAPGVYIKSTLTNGYFGIKTGTSMACPLVSAAAAIVKTIDSSFSAQETEHLLESSANDAGDAGYDIFYGYGILNLRPLCNLTDLETKKIRVLDFGIVKTDEKIIAEAKLAGLQCYGGNLTAIIALYDEGGALTYIKLFDVDCSESDTAIIQTEFPATPQIMNARLFLWSSVNGMRPIAELCTAKITSA